MSFNLLLCYINTNVSAVSSLHVVASEIAIILAAFLVSHRSLNLESASFLLIVFLYLIWLAFVRAAISDSALPEVKIVRDFMIPVTFFLLGLRYSDTTTPDLIVIYLATLVTVAAIFEAIFTDVYLSYLNIIQYYIARGTVEAKHELLATTLFISGLRPEEQGRTLLPFLGAHRISSLFLEPVSLGNFGVIIFSWALVRSVFERKLYVGSLAMAIFVIIMADSRFGASLCPLLVGLLFVPPRLMRAVLLCLPFVAVSGLIGVTYFFPDAIADDTFIGRLLSSGRILADLNVFNWLGFEAPNESTYDSGYAYAISGAGGLGVTIFWITFVMLNGGNPQFNRFRILIGCYFALVLCVSYSPFTIKTSALLWFLLGTLATAKPAALSSFNSSARFR